MVCYSLQRYSNLNLNYWYKCVTEELKFFERKRFLEIVRGPSVQRRSNERYKSKSKKAPAKTWVTEGNPNDYDIDKVLQDLVSTYVNTYNADIVN